MAPGEIKILSTEHLSNEKVLLTHYGINSTGLWMYAVCHCGYRNVCDDLWTVMIPQHQHPRHTDGRPGNPIHVDKPGFRGSFAWNYGGVPGIKAEDFDSDHSYLVQLTVTKDCGSIGPTGWKIQPTGTRGIEPSGFTGKAGTGITFKKTDPKLPFPPGPPGPGKPTRPRDPIGGGAGGGGLKIDPGRDAPIFGENQFSATGTKSNLVWEGQRDVGVHLYPSKPSNPDYQKSVIMDPIKGFGSLGGDTRGGSHDPQHFGGLDTEADGQSSINKGGYHPEGGSLLFGDGGRRYTKVGEDGLGLASSPLDMSDYYTGTRYASRDVSPDKAAEFDDGIAVPPGVDTISPGVDLAGPGAFIGGSIRSTAGGSTIGSQAQASRTYGAEKTKPSIPSTFDVEATLGTTTIVLTQDSLYQGEQIGISAGFIPNKGAEIIVSSQILIVTKDREQYIAKQEPEVTSSYENPAGSSVVVRTDKLPLGKATVMAVFKDQKNTVVGIQSAEFEVVPQYKEDSGQVYSSYTQAPFQDVSDSLKQLTRVSDKPILLKIPEKGDRSVILSQKSTSVKDYNRDFHEGNYTAFVPATPNITGYMITRTEFNTWNIPGWSFGGASILAIPRTGVFIAANELRDHTFEDLLPHNPTPIRVNGLGGAYSVGFYNRNGTIVTTCFGIHWLEDLAIGKDYRLEFDAQLFQCTGATGFIDVNNFGIKVLGYKNNTNTAVAQYLHDQGRWDYPGPADAVNINIQSGFTTQTVDFSTTGFSGVVPNIFSLFFFQPNPATISASKEDWPLIVIDNIRIGERTDASVVVSPVDDLHSERQMRARLYCPSEIEETTLLKAPITGMGFTGVGDAYRVTQFGTPIIDARGPVLIEGDAVHRDEHIVGHVPVSTRCPELIAVLNKTFPATEDAMYVNFYPSRNYQLRPAKRTWINRTGGNCFDVEFNVPYGNETIKLLVKGNESGEVPSTLTFYQARSDTRGVIAFSGINAAADKWLGLYRYPYNVGNDEFHVEQV